MRPATSSLILTMAWLIAAAAYSVRLKACGARPTFYHSVRDA